MTCVLTLGRRLPAAGRRRDAVTLGELLSAVGDRAPSPARGAGAGGCRATVTAVAYDSRQVDAGCGLRRAPRRATPTARAFARAGVAARRHRRRRREPPRRPASRCPGSRSPDARLALAALAAAFYGHPSERADARRHHRHERQDDDLVPAGLDLRSRRHASAAASARSATASATASSKRARTTPEAPDLQRHAARDGRRRAAAPA